MVKKRTVLAVAAGSLIALHGAYTMSDETKHTINEKLQDHFHEGIDINSILGFGVIVGMIAILGTVDTIRRTVSIL